MSEEAKKTVWIKCRANQSCEGNQAEVVFDKPSIPTDGSGNFIPVSGGRMVRYRCLTCKGVFHLAT